MPATVLLRLFGDALSIVALSILWSSTLTAWRRIPADMLVPMQITGAKAARVKKPMGLLFMPGLATALLLAPTLTGVAHGAATTGDALILFCLRALLAAGLGIMGLTHLRKVILTLEAEGAIPRQEQG